MIAYVSQLVQAYTRGVGFTNGGVPNADLWQVILGASARVWRIRASCLSIRQKARSQ